MTQNSINSTIPIPVAKGGTNASLMATTDGVVYYDGTRLVTTAAGVSGQLLTSNGAAVAPTYQYSPQVVKITLTSQQIKAIHGTPITLVPAQGTGTVVMPISLAAKFVRGAAYTVAADAGIGLYYVSSAGLLTTFTLTISRTVLINAANVFIADAPLTCNTTTRAPGVIDNVDLVLRNPSVTEITGDAGNTNSVIIEFAYWVATLT